MIGKELWDHQVHWGFPETVWFWWLGSSWGKNSCLGNENLQLFIWSCFPVCLVQWPAANLGAIRFPLPRFSDVPAYGMIKLKNIWISPTALSYLYQEIFRWQVCFVVRALKAINFISITHCLTWISLVLVPTSRLPRSNVSNSSFHLLILDLEGVNKRCRWRAAAGHLCAGWSTEDSPE